MPAVSPPHARTDVPPNVAVRAAGRLHLGFLDPSGTLGRRFGSIGLMIDGFQTRVELSPSGADEVTADDAAAAGEIARAEAALQRLRAATGCQGALALRLREVLPAHAGLGSGTQLALAVGRAFARLYGLDLSTAALARITGRGRRSGIGIAGFDAGGLLVDGGPDGDGHAAPLLARVAFPADWRIVVVLDTQRRGLSGVAEQDALRTLAPLARPAAADICHQVLMRVLPGALAGAFDAFSAGVNRIQQVLGAHFAPAQGGSAWTSPALERVMTWSRDVYGDEVAIGQSSWGPTGFAIVDSPAAAMRWIAAARAAGVVDHALVLRTVTACGQGATIDERCTR